MAEKTRIVGSDDKGQFNVPVPRGSIDRVDIIDLDMVLQTKDGSRLILPGAAIDAMSAKPPVVSFPDGRIGAAELLSSVGKVETPPSSIPAMTSLTQFDQKLTQGKKNRTDDAADKQAEQAQAQQVAPLPVGAGQSSVDDLMKKAEKLLDETRNKAFDPAPAQIHQTPAQTSDAPGSQPQTSKIPLYATLTIGNYAAAQTDTDAGTGVKTVYGAGGPSTSNIASGILTGDANQYGTETLSGGSAGDVFYTDAFHRATGTWNATSANLLNNAAAYAALDKETGLAPTGTAFYYAKEVALNIAGYIRRLDSVTVTGLPEGVSIQGATALGNGSFQIAIKDVVPTAATLVLVYDVTTLRALFNKDSDGDGVNDYVDINMKVTIVGQGVDALNVTKTFVLRFQDVDSTGDITNNSPILISGNGGGWSDVYVMPTAGAPQLILTNTDTYDSNLTFAQNAAATAATADGNNTVYGGNSADTILAGAGNDTIYAYAGNDLISGGNGNNLIWAGDGNDTIITGTGNDVIHAGRGENTITDGGGNNTIDIVASKTVNGVVVTGNGKDVVTITGDGDNTITVGDASDAYTDGDDTVTTANGIDTITVGDGNNKVTTGNGKKVVTAGGGDDIITTGSGDDTIAAGDGTNSIIAGDGANVITGGSGTDSVTSGTGNDDIRLGAGTNFVTDSGGSNFISTSADSGKDVISITAGTGADTNTIWVGVENDGTIDGDDTVITGNSIDTIHVGDGNNVVTTGNSKKVIYSGTGTDIITTGSGDDTIAAGDGTNIVWAGDGANVISAGADADTLIGGSGADSIVAGGGDDWIYGGTGANVTLDGGSGTDWLSFNGIGAAITGGTTTLADWLTNATGAITSVTLNSVDASGVGTVTHTGAGSETDAIGNIENFIGSRGNDVLNLSGYVGVTHILYGLDGDDVLTGSDMADTLYGGSGNDRLYGNAGNDVIFTSITSIQATANAAALSGTTVDADTDTAGLSYTSASGITITGQHNLVDGGAGADTIIGGAGNDYFVSGNTQYADASGAYDTFIGGAGFDTVDHSAFTANLVIDLSNNLGRINGGAYIAWYSSIERILTGSGNDTITGTTNDEIFYAGNGTNSVTVGGGADTAYGGTGTDYFYSAVGVTNATGSTNTAYYDGGAGYNEYWLRAGVETIVGTSGTDRIFYNNSAATLLSGVNYGVFVNLDSTNWVISNTGALTTTAGTSYWYDGTAWTTAMTGDTSSSAQHGYYGDANNDRYIGTVEQIYGSSYNDVLIGNAANNWFFGSGGSDAMYGMAGADTFAMMYSGNTNSGTDYINGGNDVAGTPDSYTLTANANGTLSLSIIGGDGVDFSSGNAINRSLVINLDTVAHNEISTNNGTGTGTGTSYAANQVSGWVNTVTLVDIERATGGNYADILYGSAADNVLSGAAGNDSLWGFGGNDFLNGGTGSNYLNGGAGNDWASYYGMTVGVEVYLADADLDGNGVNDQAGDAANWGTSNQARFTGQNGTDFDKLISIENIEGSDYADRIAGDANDNSLFGGAGADTIFGGAGNDVINGGSGDDTIEGGAGADVLTGGTGNDTLSYATSSAGVTVDLSANTATGGDATGDTISGFEYLRGSAHADTLTGTSSTNIIYGLDGNDVINGNGGADTIYGGNGNDNIITTSAIAGTSGTAYSFDGGAGTDTLTAANWTLSNLSVSKLTSIEVLDLRGASTITTSALTVTNIAGILDSASGNTLTIYLDSGDTFTTTNANVTTSAANDGQGHTGTHYTYTSGSNTYYVDVYKV